MKNFGRKLVLSVAVIGAFVGYVFRQRQEQSGDTNMINQASVTPQPSTESPSINTTNANTSPSIGGTYRNGAYVGDVTDAFYGPMQVRAIIQGGRITDVKFLQYPKDRQTSISINTAAIPILIQETIQAQSADISGVSGASASSPAYIQSLQSALDQARA